MTFIKMLENRQRKLKTLLCVGLDPSIEKFPQSILRKINPIYEFNRAIIDATNPYVCSYKPQVAYYNAVGAENELEMTIEYIKEKHPDIPIILDAKRSDIGSTSEMYAKEAFDRYKVDAVTVNPYLGTDSIMPFIKRKEKGVIVLCKTSNESSQEFQDEIIHGNPLFAIIAQKALKDWNYNKNILFVVGATYPEQMKEMRTIAPEITFLVPGLGLQGGTIKKVMENGLRTDGLGLIISSSRAIIHASQKKDFARKASEAAKSNHNEIIKSWQS